MLKQFIGALAILAGVGLVFNGCEEKNPTFNDPCPTDTCPRNDITKPEPDSSDSSNESNQGFDTNKVAIAVYQNTTTGGTKQFWTNVPVEIFDWATNTSLGKTLNTEKRNILADDRAYAFFADKDNYIKVPPQGSPKKFIFKSEFSKNDTTWKGVDTFPILRNRDDWQTHLLEVKPQ